MKFDRYGLTKDGEGVCVDAYCLSLAKIPKTYVTLMMDRDEFSSVKDEHVDWSKPFNELTHGEDPILTPDVMSAALDRFISFHYDKASSFHISKKVEGNWDEKVHLSPFLYREIDRKYRGRWMNLASFPFHIVYDNRDPREKIL